MTPELLKTEADNCDAQTGLSPAPLLGDWSIGQKVWTTVSVSGETRRMAKGEITGIHSGYCDVDVMSLHGGAPWIQQHTNQSLELV